MIMNLVQALTDYGSQLALPSGALMHEKVAVKMLSAQNDQTALLIFDSCLHVLVLHLPHVLVLHLPPLEQLISAAPRATHNSNASKV